MTLLYQQLASDGPSLAEHELKAMAKTAYEEMLSKLCTNQRADPRGAEGFSICNRVLIDHYDRLTHLGARLELTPLEEERMGQAGWEQERIDRLKVLLQMLEGGASTDLCDEYVDSLLTRRGHAPDDRSRWATQLALYPAFRDAHIDAEVELQQFLPLDVSASNEARVAEPCAPPAEIVVERAAGPAVSDFIEQALRDLECEEIWDSKSCRQARSTACLFELLVGRKPFAQYTQADFSDFKRKIRCLPNRYDMTSAASRAAVLATIALREKDETFHRKDNKDALSPRTRNRHLSSLKGLHRWAKKNGLSVPDIDFENLFIAVSKAQRGRNLRPATPKDDVKALFDLPVFTGCQEHLGGTGTKTLGARFKSGESVIFDAFYWVPILLYYTGARREEICKLQPADIIMEGGIPRIFIDFTEFGRLKNAHSVRPVPLHSEVLRLGFLDFVEECRQRGYDVLFPELRSMNSTQNFGDVYYKNVWKNLKKRGRLTSDATIHGMRHRFSTDLKAKKVFSEFRRDVMGHAGANLNEEIYSDTGPLRELLAVVEELPAVTEHLPRGKTNLPPRAMRRRQPLKRRM